MRIVIGVSGKIGSGKDEVAKYLVDKYKFLRNSMADPMKEGCKALFGFSDDQLWGDLKAEVDSFWHVTPRRVLQIIGTEMFRIHLIQALPEINWIGDNFWVYRWLKWYTDSKAERVVVPDIRFLNEALMINNLNNGQTKAFVIRVNRNVAHEKIVAEHKSENDLDDYKFNYVITNNETIDDLHHKINQIMWMNGIK